MDLGNMGEGAGAGEGKEDRREVKGGREVPHLIAVGAVRRMLLLLNAHGAIKERDLIKVMIDQLHQSLQADQGPRRNDVD